MEDRATNEGDRTRGAWGEPSPFASPAPTAVLDQLKSEGEVRYLLVSGERDDTTWGIIGAIWLSNDAERGGFLVSPDALWPGCEMARSYRSALSRGWTDEQIFSYWDEQTGSLGTYMIDPDRRVDSLLEVARVVGLL
jgi:hypothetical protein